MSQSLLARDVDVANQHARIEANAALESSFGAADSKVEPAKVPDIEPLGEMATSKAMGFAFDRASLLNKRASPNQVPSGKGCCAANAPANSAPIANKVSFML